MFVAYVVSSDDTYLIPIDGVGLIAAGSTRERAIEKLRVLYLEGVDEADLPDYEAAWEAVLAGGDDSVDFLHVHELDAD